MRFDLGKDLTMGELIHPALGCREEKEAIAYLHDLVEYYMVRERCTKEEAVQKARSGIEYYASRCSEETHRRVQKLFNTVSVLPEFEDASAAWKAGLEMGERLKRGEAFRYRTQPTELPDRPFDFMDWLEKK